MPDETGFGHTTLLLTDATGSALPDQPWSDIPDVARLAPLPGGGGWFISAGLEGDITRPVVVRIDAQGAEVWRRSFIAEDAPLVPEPP